MNKFSIITPTFNRAKYLPRIYECLSQQDISDIEWIIIDDGSTDNTKDVISNFERRFKIKYAYQENAGKPTAMNLGFQMADSYISVFLDSDDILCPHVFNVVWEYFNIDNEMFKHDCACLTGLSQYKNKDIIGNKFPHDYHVSDYIRYAENKNIKGDKCEFFITKILKKYSYPTFKKEKNIAPSIVHIRIALTHKTLYINKVFQEKQFLPDGLSTQNYWLMYPLGSELYYNETSIPPFSLRLQIRNSGQYIFFAKRNKKEHIFKEAKNKIIFPLGVLAYYLLRLKYFLKKFQIFKEINDTLKGKSKHWKKISNE